MAPPCVPQQTHASSFTPTNRSDIGKRKRVTVLLKAFFFSKEKKSILTAHRLSAKRTGWESDASSSYGMCRGEQGPFPHVTVKWNVSWHHISSMVFSRKAKRGKYCQATGKVPHDSGSCGYTSLITSRMCASKLKWHSPGHMVVPKANRTPSGYYSVTSSG